MWETHGRRCGVLLPVPANFSMLKSGAIVTSHHYRPKRPARKRKPQPPLASIIVTPARMKKKLGPVIRLREQEANDNGQEAATALAVPPGYRRPARPKLDPFTGIIDSILVGGGKRAYEGF